MTYLDPRHLNERCDTSDIDSFLREYAERLRAALLGVDTGEFEHARRLIEEASSAGRRIYSIGNGGSAAIADHLCCDWVKGTYKAGHPVIDSTSLTANVALYSAIANDFGFEDVFSTQIDFLGRPGDVLVAISSSGNSRNIVNAIALAKQRGMRTIGMSGFSGGAMANDAAVRPDAMLYVEVNNYGIVEDAHQALMHILAQYIAAGRDG